jgi:hypothetical protein
MKFRISRFLMHPASVAQNSLEYLVSGYGTHFFLIFMKLSFYRAELDLNAHVLYSNEFMALSFPA